MEKSGEIVGMGGVEEWGWMRVSFMHNIL